MRTNGKGKDDGNNGLVAVAIDKDKGSQYALKWAIDHLMHRGKTLILIHVNTKLQSVPNPTGSNVSISEVNDEVASTYRRQLDAQTKELFLPFRCFCTLKEIHCKDIILDDTDIAKAITEYAAQNAIENLVMGAASRGGFVKRFRTTDVPTSISKMAPDFCTVYVISKGKISSVRSAVRQAPATSPLRTQIQNQNSIRSENSSPHLSNGPKGDAKIDRHPQTENQHTPLVAELDSIRIRSPFARGSRPSNVDSDISFVSSTRSRHSIADSDISFVSSDRPSLDRMQPSLYDHMESSRTSRLSNSSDMYDNRSFESSNTPPNNSMTSQESGGSTWPPNMMEDVEAEMKRLRLELKQTMDMYSTACKEALTAKQKARDLHLWKMEEEQRLEEARLAEESALAIAENEKMKCKAAMEAAEAARRIAQLEAQKRMNAEMKAQKEADEKKSALTALANTDVRYRRYTIEEIEVATEYFTETRKIGEGGYGPVYRCYLDHTHVAIKVLRPDAAQGRSQFQQEVEVLSRIRHPNMVLLLGACPEYGCLVYEYMANGSLDDRLFRRGNTPVIPWQLRFRIAAEIATGLLFLHQTKPEPLVHRDLKPGNILLDRNFVSKISDVGLARLVPPTVADHVTQYRMTATAGTFCYIDPEYQQTGMLGIKSDIYSLGIMLLQIITAKPPMGLTHHVERAIEKGTFAEMLDPEVLDWPVEEALHFAKLSLKCAELRRKDRPDLGEVILPELNKLADLAEEQMPHFMVGSTHSSPHHSYISINQDVISDPLYIHSGYNSSRSRSSASSMTGTRMSLH